MLRESWDSALSQLSYIIFHLVTVIAPVLADHRHVGVEVAAEELGDGLGQVCQLTSGVIHLFRHVLITVLHTPY